MKKILSILLLLLLALSLTGCGDFIFSEVTPPTPTSTADAATSPLESPPPVQKEPEDSEFVAVKDYIPELFVDLKYASSDNFTGQVIYSFNDAYLRYGTVKKLQRVSAELNERGLYLKIWDAFRPTAAQFRLWEVYPDPNFVSDPNIKYSSHSRGNTVDICIVNDRAEEVELPTAFDDFSALADRDYSDCTQAAAENALLLQTVMEKHGFIGYSGEWWHFSDGEEYPVEEDFDPAVYEK